MHTNDGREEVEPEKGEFLYFVMSTNVHALVLPTSTFQCIYQLSHSHCNQPTKDA